MAAPTKRSLPAVLAAACLLSVALPARCPAAPPDSVASVRTTNVDPLLIEYFERWFDDPA